MPRLRLTRHQWAIAGATLALNVLLEGPLSGRFRVPASLAAGGAISGLALQEGADAAELGLEVNTIPVGTATGLIEALPIGLCVVAGSFLPATRALYDSRRVDRMNPKQALYEAFVRIPLGTALPEELIFRGAILGRLTARRDSASSVLLSSMLFGAWHVVPTLAERRRAGLTSRTGDLYAVLVSAVVTTLAGIYLARLRLRTRSLISPVLVHAAANASGLLTAWLKARNAARVNAEKLAYKSTEASA